MGELLGSHKEELLNEGLQLEKECQEWIVTEWEVEQEHSLVSKGYLKHFTTLTLLFLYLIRETHTQTQFKGSLKCPS